MRLFFYLKTATIFLYMCLLVGCANSKQDFVRLNGKMFKLNGENFYPVILNYSTNLNYDKNELWVSPNKSYADKSIDTKQLGLAKFKADMQQVKTLGFNAVRIIGGTEYEMKAGKRVVNASVNGKDTLVFLTDDLYTKYVNAVTEMLGVLKEVGLKAILLQTNYIVKNDTASLYLKEFLTEFKKEPTILAWDLFNEPLYFDKMELKKTEVVEVVKKWRAFYSAYAPNQLITIGLTGSREVFEWDPNMLDVDFVSFHPYEFHKGEIENEIYWYGKNVTKPWIIGETGFSADGDSVNYETQKAFAKKFADRAVNCGASGFSWWQYKDVAWYDFQSNYLGLLTQSGMVKPAALVFKDYNFLNKSGTCDCLPDYYNYHQENKFAITGKLLDKLTGKPIESGVIVAWNQYYSKSNITYTKADGTFVLYGNYKLYHYIVSATMYSVVKTDVDWDKVAPKNDSLPCYNVGVIKIKPL